ncbi:hypothetical protein ES708_27737 [subsurface metagenome]
MATIDIGVPAENYTSSWCDGTLINKSNPANASGKITNVQIYTKAIMPTVYVATFYRPDPSGFPNNLTTRDTEYISDSIAVGYHAFDVDLDVEAGDYIGIMFQNGDIEKKIGGEQGVWYINHADWLPCDNKTFYLQAGNALAIYGTGTIPDGLVNGYFMNSVPTEQREEVFGYFMKLVEEFGYYMNPTK